MEERFDWEGKDDAVEVGVGTTVEGDVSSVRRGEAIYSGGAVDEAGLKLPADFSTSVFE